MAKANNNSEQFLSRFELEALEKDLKYSGYLLPTNDDELERFEQIYGSTQVIFPEYLKSPKFLNKEEKTTKKEALQKCASKIVVTKKNINRGNDYFKKIVLAAEIANELHIEPTFGHTKFVKILYLCQEVCNMELSTNYGKYAAGPLDPKLMYSIDAEFKKQKWFKIIKREQFGYKYIPLEKVDSYRGYYLGFYSDYADEITHIINLFRKQTTGFCEIVATLYAVWKELGESNTIVNNATLEKGFYAWNEAKKKYSLSEIESGITWMKEQKIIPL